MNVRSETKSRDGSTLGYDTFCDPFLFNRCLSVPVSRLPTLTVPRCFRLNPFVCLRRLDVRSRQVPFRVIRFMSFSGIRRTDPWCLLHAKEMT